MTDAAVLAVAVVFGVALSALVLLADRAGRELAERRRTRWLASFYERED